MGKSGGKNNSNNSHGDDKTSRIDSDSGNSSDEPALNWRYEKGLLRSVGLDGIASNMCLGPRNRVMDGSTDKPYELILQECPHVPGANMNIFWHPSTITTSSSSSPIDAATAPVSSTPKPTKTNARHMQFLMAGDGRVRSLAPVVEDPTNQPSSVDMVVDKPFCVTVMKWEGDEKEKAYLAPCYRESNSNSNNQNQNQYQYQVFDNRETQDLMSQIQPDQQVFDLERGSSYDSFLMDLHSEDENLVQLAYQIGFTGSASPSLLNNRKNYDDFESIVIRFTSENNIASSSSSPPSPSLVSEKVVSSVWSNSESQSGIVSYELSSLSPAGTMEAHLMGQSRNGLEITWLASTSFEVSDPIVDNTFPNSWTWSVLVFSGMMFCYLGVLKATNFFCPAHNSRRRRRRKEPRNSELTAATVNTINHETEIDVNDWGVVPTIDVPLPNRISEEEENVEEEDRSSNQSVFDSSFDSVYDRNSTLHTVTTVDIDSTLGTSSDVESVERHRQQ